MKPKDLKFPFSEGEPQCQLHDRLLYVPKYHQGEWKIPFLQWKEEAIFGNSNPVVMEIGSGNGHWIMDQAIQSPHMNFIAVEIRFDRIKKIWSKRANLNLSNLFIVCGEAFTFAQTLIPPSSVTEVHINFPDPWPKRRHEKHRLIKPEFVKEITRILTEKGTLTFVTDDLPYMELACAHFIPHLHPLNPSPYYEEMSSNYGDSTFEKLWRALGRKIYRLKVKPYISR